MVLGFLSIELTRIQQIFKYIMRAPKGRGMDGNADFRRM